MSASWREGEHLAVARVREQAHPDSTTNARPEFVTISSLAGTEDVVTNPEDFADVAAGITGPSRSTSTHSCTTTGRPAWSALTVTTNADPR